MPCCCSCCYGSPHGSNEVYCCSVFFAQGRLNMTLMALVSAERAAQSKAAATSSGVNPNRWVMSGMTSTFLLAKRFKQSGYCKARHPSQRLMSSSEVRQDESTAHQTLGFHSTMHKLVNKLCQPSQSIGDAHTA